MGKGRIDFRLVLLPAPDPAPEFAAEQMPIAAD